MIVRSLALSCSLLALGCAGHALRSAEAEARAEAAYLDALQADAAGPLPGSGDEERAAADAAHAPHPAHGSPGPHHAHLAERVGEWDAHYTVWQAPGVELGRMQGRTVARMIHGGLFLAEETTSSEMIPGHDFVGTGFTGWDNTADKLVMVWIDNAGSGMYYAEGGCNADCSEQVAEGLGTDPHTGQTVRYRYVTRRDGPDATRFEMWVAGEDGEFWRMLRCDYARRG